MSTKKCLTILTIAGALSLPNAYADKSSNAGVHTCPSVRVIKSSLSQLKKVSSDEDSYFLHLNEQALHGITFAGAKIHIGDDSNRGLFNCSYSTGNKELLHAGYAILTNITKCHFADPSVSECSSSNVDDCTITCEE